MTLNFEFFIKFICEDDEGEGSMLAQAQRSRKDRFREAKAAITLRNTPRKIMLGPISINKLLKPLVLITKLLHYLRR